MTTTSERMLLDKHAQIMNAVDDLARFAVAHRKANEQLAASDFNNTDEYDEICQAIYDTSSQISTCRQWINNEIYHLLHPHGCGCKYC
jgi:hypothetical protein